MRAYFFNAITTDLCYAAWLIAAARPRLAQRVLESAWDCLRAVQGAGLD